MNKDTRIKVKTNVGMTDEAETGENVAQGTVEGCLLSSSNVDKGLNEAFKNSSKEINYTNIKLQPLLFKDDVMRASDTLESLKFGNNLIDHVMEEKLLSLNTDKSKFMIIGSSKAAREMREKAKFEVIKLAGEPIKESEMEKYLGDYFHEKGNSQSIVETVKKRYGKAREAVIDIKNQVEDVRAEAIGPIKTGLEIFELSVIPFLLHNCETWDNIPVEAMEILNKVHLTFLRMLLKTPITTPIPSLFWETGSINIQAKIEQRKLSFYHNILNMNETSLARNVAEVQLINNYPGLMRDCKKLLKNYKIDDENIETISKFTWKKNVKNAIHDKVETDTLENMKKYKKIKYELKVNETLELKQYMKSMNLSRARMKFSLETEMVKNFKFNFMNEREYEKSNWSCDFCWKEKKKLQPR